MNKDRFDRWAKDYDKSISESMEGYPFEGYYEVLEYICGLIKEVDGKRILDIGVGTGLLTHELYVSGAEIVGIDFSKEMIEKAKNKMPDAVFLLYDFNEGIPDDLCGMRLDFVVSSYAIHHIDDQSKLDLINSVRDLLREDGKILIGDVAFRNEEELERCKKKYKGDWDEEEYYIVAEELCKELNKRGLRCDYTQISSCAGVLIAR